MNGHMEFPDIKISPHGDTVPAEVLQQMFETTGATDETIFRRWELNEVIDYTDGAGIDIGCGLNKIHSAAIGIDARLGKKDYFNPLGANISCEKRDDWVPLHWFSDASLDFAAASHFLEHLSNPRAMVQEIWKKLKHGGFMLLVLPDNTVYPRIGEPGANPDHKWDVFPGEALKLVRDSAEWEVVAFNTLQKKLKDQALTPWDQAIAARYGHRTLNFSFELVCRKL